MQILCDSRSMQAAVHRHAELNRLITEYMERLSDPLGDELGNLVQFVVMEKGDSVLDLETALGFAVMKNRSNGLEWDDPDFVPSWEVIEAHQYWYEIVYVLADDGFGIVVFVHGHADPQLIAMLQRYIPAVSP